MFETLTPAQPDKILALMALYREDSRTNKIDLGVGVYKDEQGATPIMRAVREAEKRLYGKQTTKTYVGMAGDASFAAGMVDLVLGDAAPKDRVRCAQAVGGSGALRIIAELLAMSRPDATVWVSDPTWPNHIPMMKGAGLKTADYPYFDAATGKVRFDAMLEGLKKAKAGDIVLLHGCCHNPTGANLTLDQWKAVTDLILERGLFPFVDLAYQGFGEGLDADAEGVRHLASKASEMAIAASASKNFSVYRDRVGAAILLAKDRASADTAFSQLLAVVRAMYSMPPDHGGAALALLMNDKELLADWKGELEEVRLRMLRLRKGLAEALRRKSNSDRFDFVAEHRGMFSRLGLTQAQVERLREEHGVYMVGDSRINVAGLPEDRLDELAAAIVSVLD